MNRFEMELNKGNFLICECTKCKNIVWPPTDFCNHCFGFTTWRKDEGVGRIIEFSRKDHTYFCLVEFKKKIRIIGAIKDSFKEPKIGKEVKLINCKLADGNYQFDLEII